MGRPHDYIKQNLEKVNREPTRTCGRCTNGKVTVMEEDGVNAKGKPQSKNVTRDCGDCGGRGVR